MAAYDKLYRRLFEDSRVARDLIIGFLLPPDSWQVEMLDLISAVHVTDSGRMRVSDMIWKVRVQWLKGPGLQQPQLLYVLLEFQSRPDGYMALRALVYAGLLLQQLQANERLRMDGLPDTLSVVVYNGRQRWTGATDVGALLRKALPPLHDDQLVHRYRLIDEAGCVASGSLPGENLAAALFRSGVDAGSGACAAVVERQAVGEGVRPAAQGFQAAGEPRLDREAPLV